MTEKSNQISKEDWLKEQVFVDIYGRPYNLSDVPMTYMTREKAFSKRGHDEETIQLIWEKVKDEQ